MTGEVGSQPQRIRERLAGEHILVTGSTGFLAKAFVEKLLRSVDTIGGIHLLVRPRPGGTSPHQRVFRDVLGSRAYDRLRASLGDGFARLCEEKIHVVGGDLTQERMGLEPEAYAALAKRITLIVNSAATVTFDEQLDIAVELNALGPSRLVRFARECGNVPFLHVSTCYVCGARTGDIAEDLSVPEAARDRLPRCADTDEVDLAAMVRSMLAEADAIKEKRGAGTETCRRELIDAGMRRARSYGWNDTYTFTKWLGEQILVRDHGGVPVVIFRPAVIESSFEEPTPGWIDGLRMADPLIVAYGRGKLNEFPALPDIALDLIPVDFVANAMIAALPVGDTRRDPIPVFHCASSGRHPLYLKDVQVSLERAFHRRPMVDDEGRPIDPGRLNLVDLGTFEKRWCNKRRRLVRVQRLLKGLGVAGRRVRKLSTLSRQIEQLVYFAKIYSPYTHLDCRFADDKLRAVAEKLHPRDREEFPFDVETIDWDDYLVNRHVPGLRSFVLGTGLEPTVRIRVVEELDRAVRWSAADALRADNLFEMFRRSAEMFDDKPALQIRRDNRWVRYTYDDCLRTTGTIMRRFNERGLKPGDRVAICGESSPEWGLTYLAVMRAGLTAVPLDPQLPPPEAWSAARFARAGLMCAAPATFEGLSRHRGDGDADIVVMCEPFVPPPGASRDPAPDPVPVNGTATASILFTSGTTVAPRAVQLTHRNLLANANDLIQVHPVHPADELLSVLPMYHAFEFTGGFLVPLAGGATITYVEQLKGPLVRLAMQATGTTIMLVVPRLLRMFHDGIESELAKAGLFKRGVFRLLGFFSNLMGRRAGRWLFSAIRKRFGGRLRMFVCGGSRLDPDLFDAFERMGFPVYEGYGLTETSPVLTVNPPDRSLRASVGKVLPNVGMDIRNRNLEGVGEVWVRGPSVMSGYLDNPDATAEVIVDGWLRTGDLGRMDADGYLYITGRSKDLVVTAAGENVYPDEIELCYRDLPYVKELCVFGVESDEGLGEAVHAVVVIDGDAVADLDRSSIEREIRMAAASVSESLPTHRRIAALHFWDRELPKTSTLKAKRGLVRDIVRSEDVGSGTGIVSPADVRAAAEHAGAAAASDNAAAFEAVRRILSRQTNQPEDAIDKNAHLLLDLGIDSIGKIEVLGETESRFKMRIDDETGAKIARVADLLRVIGDRKPVAGGVRDASAWRRRLAAEPAPVELDGRLPAPLVPVRWLLRGGVSLFLRTYVRVRCEGRENIPRAGAFILAPNHSSHLDSPAVLRAVGGRRRVWVVGAEDYFFNTWIKRFIFGKVLDTIAFDRRADGVRGLRRCGGALSRGDGLLIFPEGTRSITGEIQPFKIGVAVLAMERNVPIVPVHIDRTYKLLRKGQRFIRPGSITVTFGEPIHPPSPEETVDHYAAFREVTEQVQDAVTALFNGASA